VDKRAPNFAVRWLIYWLRGELDGGTGLISLWCCADCSVDGRWGPWEDWDNVRWGPWEDWGQCSVTCGDGISTKTRQCNWPAAQRGGAQCSGDSAETKSCTMSPCPGNDRGFTCKIMPWCRHSILTAVVSLSFSVLLVDFSNRITLRRRTCVGLAIRRSWVRFPVGPLSSYPGQLSLPSLRGR